MLEKIPHYNGFLHWLNLIVPKGDSMVGSVMEVVKTVLPLAGLYPNKRKYWFLKSGFGCAGMMISILPFTNIVHMVGVSIWERSLAGRKWDLARNTIEFVCIENTRRALGVHTLFNVWEALSSVSTTFQELWTAEGFGRFLKGVGSGLYLGEIILWRSKYDTIILTIASLVVQGLYQAFQLRSQGMKLLQHGKVINYQTCLLALDVTVKATMMVVRLAQVYKARNAKPLQPLTIRTIQ